MKQGWTGFNKVLLIISMIAGFIMVIVLTSFAADSYLYDDMAWAIFIGGAFTVLSFHALWGLFVEISTNIAQLPLPHKLDDDTEKIKFNWTCPKCGGSNYITCDFCQSCGKARISETTEKADNSTDTEVQS